jgi:hypothetical protein
MDRIFARSGDGVEDAFVARVGRGVAFHLLQNPVGFKDADVREMPDDRAKAAAGTLMQMLFGGHHVEQFERRGARRLKHLCELFSLLRQCVFHPASPRAGCDINAPRINLYSTFIVNFAAL